MIYTFNRSGVLQLLKVTQEARSHQVPYSTATDPGLVLVGDHGVYLMSNRTDPDNKGDDNCVYAEECNPRTLDFDLWWENKHLGFGGDDGVEFLPLADVVAWISGQGELCIRMSLNRLSLITRQPK